MWLSDNITFCDNRKCTLTSCIRNSKNIKHPEIPHSYAKFEGDPVYCKKVKKEKENGK